jgi:hypothetical protein
VTSTSFKLAIRRTLRRLPRSLFKAWVVFSVLMLLVSAIQFGRCTWLDVMSSLRIGRTPATQSRNCYLIMTRGGVMFQSIVPSNRSAAGRGVWNVSYSDGAGGEDPIFPYSMLAAHTGRVWLGFAFHSMPEGGAPTSSLVYPWWGVLTVALAQCGLVILILLRRRRKPSAKPIRLMLRLHLQYLPWRALRARFVVSALIVLVGLIQLGRCKWLNTMSGAGFNTYGVQSRLRWLGIAKDGMLFQSVDTGGRSSGNMWVAQFSDGDENNNIAAYRVLAGQQNQVWLGFAYYDMAYQRQQTALVIPWWALWVVVLTNFAIATLLFVRQRRKRRRRRRNLCIKCGYDLRATPERCPECGTAVEISQG